MESSDERRERRKYQRYLPGDFAFAVCESPLYCIGTLLDISAGGISFQYAHESTERWDSLKGSIMLDLIKSKPSRIVTRVECKVVYDTVVPWKIGVFRHYHLRRCGVQFGELSQDQFSVLDHFIEAFTVQGN
jgi:hypothetical protein